MTAPGILPLITPELELPDELVFVDCEIRDFFKGKPYVYGIPTMVQLNKNMKTLLDPYGHDSMISRLRELTQQIGQLRRDLATVNGSVNKLLKPQEHQESI